ncbi:MAG: hypothetical protein SVU32_06015 [Candidatus Nanohaloarchaea archaeon]|nr:hypothetical protein [Candidatus Nanohaloarchaea archaeon]
MPHHAGPPDTGARDTPQRDRETGDRSAQQSDGVDTWTFVAGMLLVAAVVAAALAVQVVR